jgi:putative oxidoreductase
MKSIENTVNLIGRILIASLFLPAGISKLMGFDGTVAYFSSLGLALPAVLAVAVIVIEIVGGISLIVGYKTQMTAIILALFTLGASIIGHAYWAVSADQVFVAKLLFYKNIAIVGGLLILAGAGAGQISLDRSKSN